MASPTSIVVLCGIPGGGKTRLVTGLERRLQTPAAAELAPAEEPDACRVVLVEYDKLLPDDSDLSALAWRARRDIVFRAVSDFLCREMAPRTANRATGTGMETTRGTEAKNGLEAGSNAGQETGGTADLTGELVGEVWSDTTERCRQLFSDVREAKGRRLFIVVDDNMFYRSMRYQYYQLAREARVGFCQVFVDVDESVARSRNSSRAGPVSTEAFRRVSERMERPDPGTFSWERNTIVVDGENCGDNLETIASFLLSTKCRDLVPDPKPEVDELRVAESRKVSRENFVHQSDQKLRKIIAEFMKTSTAKKRHSAALAKSKTEVLHLLRQPDFVGDRFDFNDVERAFWECFYKLV